MPDGFTALSDTMFATRKIRVRSDLAAVFPDVNDTRFREWFTRQDDGSYTLQHKFGASHPALGIHLQCQRRRVGSAGAYSRHQAGRSGPHCRAKTLNHDNRPDEAAEWLIELQTSKRSTIVEQLKTEGKLSVETVATAIRDEYQREFWGEGQSASSSTNAWATVASPPTRATASTSPTNNIHGPFRPEPSR